MGTGLAGAAAVSCGVSSNVDTDHVDLLCLVVQNGPLLGEAHEHAAPACLPETKNKVVV